VGARPACGSNLGRAPTADPGSQRSAAAVTVRR